MELYLKRIPQRTLKAINEHVRRGNRWHQGSFVTAVLSNNLDGAVANADLENMTALRDIMMYIWNNIPCGCYGSKERFERWQGTQDEVVLEHIAKVEQEVGL